MTELEKLRGEVLIHYKDFFIKNEVNTKTGILNNKDQSTERVLHFATMPHIGDNYTIAKKKILFVGLDIGKDESKGCIQGFDERKDNIQALTKNPHIAGSFVSALYLLKDVNNWQEHWQKYSSDIFTAQRLYRQHGEPLNDNVMSYVALTNFHKYVTENRKNRSGDADRKSSYNLEIELFCNEVKALNPDIIFFQSVKFINHTVLSKIKDKTIIIAPHPSNRAPKGRAPLNYIEKWLYVNEK